ncbi:MULTISPECIES: ATP-binding protein [Sutcliffiella]|uniref:ATP-binding protein n=1 Tax=Sutcliffiella TaxID=2837511 RepID=UPI0008310512|nr:MULTISPECIES: ATP-binding protein [Sutcliffiella]MED4014938.1 ATP-binding protein [Sutcliffiella cohnii]WBL17327.1 ATP-binding protein [Sutcliffiella sp. NC1]
MGYYHSPVQSEIDQSDPDSNNISLFLVIDQLGKIKYCSTSSETLLNMDNSKLIGKPIREHIHQEDLYLVENLVEQPTNSASFLVRLKTADGFLCGKANIVSVGSSANINEREWLFTFSQVPGWSPTNNKLYREKGYTRYESNALGDKPLIENYAHDLIEKLPNGVLIIVDGKVEYINWTGCQLLGIHNRMQIIEKDVYRFIDPKFHDIVEHRLTSVARGKNVGLMEQQWIRADGSLIDFDVMSTPTMFRGKIASFVVLVNIAHRKNFQNILQKSRERFRTLIQNTIDTIGIICEEKWVFINESGLKMLEANSYGEIIGKSIFHNIAENHFKDIWKRTVNSSKHEKKHPLFEQAWTTFQDKKLYTEMVAIPTTYLGKKALQIIVRDISERKKAEELMVQSEKLSVAGQLAAGIAHEIRNPLTAIKGFFKLIESGNYHTSDYYQIINGELNRIELICSELLLLAKPQAVQFRTVSISALLKDVTLLLETQAIINDVWFEFDFQIEKDYVKADGNQLKQVFINIIKNGIEAMENGGTLSVRTAVQNGFLSILISDEGPGISEKVLSKLGEPFFTTKENGTGLGLMISFNIIKNLNGSIEIENKKDKKGTTFNIQLPLEGYN